jgi:Recombination endonuclease VII
VDLERKERVVVLALIKPKKCRECGESDLLKLVIDKNRPQGVRNLCRNCRQKSERGGKIKDANLRRSYGITLSDFNKMLLIQNNCCLICNRHRNELSTDFHVDHCHKTGKVRALLCSNCNQGLGNFRDSIGLLIAASEYLKKF